MTVDASRPPADQVPPPPRLLIADDDAVVRSALAMQLHRAFDIVGAARDAPEAISMAEAHKPDVAVIDVQMPGGGGLHAVREIHSRVPGVTIVVLSSDETDAGVLAMLEAGAVSYVRKGRTAPELIDILRESIAAHATLVPASSRPAVSA